MVNKKYKSGYYYERKAIKELEKSHNCFYVMRAGGSKGLFDLIGINTNFVYAIQVKKSNATKKEIEKIKLFPKTKFLWKGIWIWNKQDNGFKKIWL